MFFTEITKNEDIVLFDEISGTKTKLCAYLRSNGLISIGIDAPKTIRINKQCKEADNGNTRAD